MIVVPRPSSLSDRERAAVETGEAARDRKAEAAAFRVAAQQRVDLAERLQGERDLRLPHPDAGILDADEDQFALAHHGKANRAAGIRELHGVSQEVQHDLDQPAPVGRDRDAFLTRFVDDYNRTRLKCLDYRSPLQALTNPPGPNTFAGVTSKIASGAATAACLKDVSAR